MDCAAEGSGSSGRSSRHVLVLGSTGSIGCQALEVVATLPRVTVVGLAADRSVDLLLAQATQTGVRRICLRDARAAADAAARAPELDVLAGDAGVRELIQGAAATAADEGATLTVLNGVVGAAGLRATMVALEAGATLALANKESMVAGGPFVLAAARRSGSLILPVDSEHSAIFQCLGEAPDGVPGEEAEAVPGYTPRARAVEEVLLTGSGGPFRGRTVADLGEVTPEQALKHPTWAMGAKISIDSATLMNKGLEVIEAHYLFGVPYDRISVLVNPQSIVHSMVRFGDGAILAHLGVPDMRTPIGYALAYPERPALPMVKRLDLIAAQLSFEAPDTRTFRCLELAQEAGRLAAEAEAAGAEVPHESGAASRAGAKRLRGVQTVAAPIVLNAANEVAVAAFLAGRLAFLDIAVIVEKCLTWLGDEPVSDIDDVYASDAEARKFAQEAVSGAA